VNIKVIVEASVEGSISKMNTLKYRFKSILKELSPKLTKTDYEQVEELADARELGIAFENFCTQLYERDALCSPEQIHEIALIGEAMEINEKYWTIIAVN
jgi:hypothetical protein